MNIYYEPVNLNQWNIFNRVSATGHIEPFLATSSMEIGDIVLLHVGQQNKQHKSGIYAIGEIVEGPFILRNSPEDYCNDKKAVNVKVTHITYCKPYITHEECLSFINQFRTVHRINPAYYGQILTLLNERVK